MIYKILLLVIFIIALFAGSAHSASEFIGNSQNLITFAKNGFYPEIPDLRIDGFIKYKSIINRFGTPLKKSSKKEADIKEPDVIEEYTTLEYAGLEIITSTPLPLKDSWVVSIKLTGGAYELKHGLKLGMNLSRFIEVLGPPTEPKKNLSDMDIRYVSHQSEIFNEYTISGHIIIDLEVDHDDKVKTISWRYAAD